MNPPAANEDGGRTEVERFLVAGGAGPPPSALSDYGLGALAYERLPPGHPERARWRDAYVIGATSHLLTLATLAPLVRAWRTHGIEVLVFKGFYLAEFLYPSPAERFYGDVDVLVPEGDAVAAKQLAVEHGWLVAASRNSATSSNVHSHMEAVLTRPGVAIDLHRFVIHSDTADQRLPSRYTAAAWEASQQVAWQETTIRVLDPRDSALMGLIAGRAWSHDAWHLKPADYLDLQFLRDRVGLTREALVGRAEELGCPRTAALILERCDPWRGHLDLRPPSAAQQRRWGRAVDHERGPRRGWRRWWPTGASLPGLAATLPVVLHARRLLQRYRDPEELLGHLRVPAGRSSPLTAPERRALFANTRVGAWLVQPSGDRCLVRSLTIFRTLRQRGEPVTLHLGVDADGRRHAWIRYDDASRPHSETWPPCPGARAVATLAPALPHAPTPTPDVP
jgi:hypothetical protein